MESVYPRIPEYMDSVHSLYVDPLLAFLKVWWWFLDECIARPECNSHNRPIKSRESFHSLGNMYMTVNLDWKSRLQSAVLLLNCRKRLTYVRVLLVIKNYGDLRHNRFILDHVA